MAGDLAGTLGHVWNSLAAVVKPDLPDEFSKPTIVSPVLAYRQNVPLSLKMRPVQPAGKLAV